MNCLCPPPRFEAGIARRTERAFTMVEIALSLAIIAFALVAIIGVLPLGMGVQQQNREQTIINQDAGYFLDAIRSGARGLDDLTNYVGLITNSVQEYDAATNLVGAPVVFVYTYTNSYRNGSPTAPPVLLDCGSNIVGVLSTPKYIPGNGGNFFSNHVVAYVRALNGLALDKYPQQDPNVLDLAFGYRLLPEIVPVTTFNPGSAYVTNLQANLHDLRLTIRWPLLAGGNIGHRLVFHTVVAGELVNQPANSPTWFFQPQTYVKAQ